MVLSLPNEIQYAILSHLDSSSLLNASHTCSKWYALSVRIFERLFQNECHGDIYAEVEGKEFSGSKEKYLFNRKIVHLAENSWQEWNIHSWQYRMFSIFYRSYYPVSLHPLSSDILLYSKVGCRSQILPLVADQESNCLKISADWNIVINEFPRNIGKVKKVFSFSHYLVLIAEKISGGARLITRKLTDNSSLSFSDAQIENVTAATQKENLIALGSDRGEVNLLRLDEDCSLEDVTRIGAFDEPINWMAFNGRDTLFLKTENRFIFLSGKNFSAAAQLGFNIRQVLVAESRLFVITPDDRLCAFDYPAINPRIVCEDAKNIADLQGGKFLVQTSDNSLQLWRSDRMLSAIKMGNRGKLRIAAAKERLIAAALDDAVLILGENSGALDILGTINLPEERGNIYDLLFTSRLELIVTTEKGYIFSYCPFDFTL